MLRHLLTIILFVPLLSFSQKMKGICFSSPKNEIQKGDIQEIADMNANWIGFVPYAYIDSGKVLYDLDIQWKGERIEEIRKGIQFAHELGLKVMIKPDVWILDGSYTGRYSPPNNDWETLENGYFTYLQKLLQLAIEEEVELLCLGSEWGRFAKNRPSFWGHLIAEVRKQYKGLVSYCANWDDFESFPFWEQMDLIGIDWYAPIATTSNAKFKSLLKGWKKNTKSLQAYYEKTGKKIFFPEFGFKSTERSVVKPWQFEDDSAESEEAQNNGFKTYFKTIWKKDWYAGGFVWEWYADHDEESGFPRETDYTPQGKLAEQTIREGYRN